MEQSKVAVIKGERGFEPVFRALDLIDYKSAIAGFSRVLIKVNFITTMTWDTGATTDPVVVEALIQRLKQLPVEIWVVESDATMTNADKAFEATGMAEMCGKYGVKCLNLRHIEDKVKIKIPDGKALKDITVPRVVAESAIISAAKMKTHSATKVTLGMKNMFGLLPDKFKFKYHAMGISKVIVDINSVLKPQLTIIDGFTAMEGKGPIEGTPIEMNLILAGRDPVATDATSSRIMGIDPHEISHIKDAAQKRQGNIDNIEIVGEQIDNVKKTFKRK
ncbi:MAG: DUF362 domain-containing protein [Nitrososphaerota archaeon]|jgi:uncharacterized protein (DUF362 family)|nr:DUF362 domain-containing protein [Nitrososphaerota archaeon]